MQLFKPVFLGAALASAVAVGAFAAEPTSTTSTNPPQVATNPGVPYSSARLPGPKVGPSTWIASPSSAAPAPVTAPTPAPQTEGSYYSGKGFGPKPN